MEVKVRIWGKGTYKMKPIKGKSVTIPGYEEYQFFIHRPVVRLGYHRASFSKIITGWEITEATTGMAPGDAHGRTQVECINRTKQILDAKGKESLSQAIERDQTH